MIHFIHLFKLHDFEVGVLFVSDKSWGNWTVSFQETLALLEELRSSGYYPDGGCLHAARLAAKEARPKNPSENPGWSGQGGRGSGSHLSTVQFQKFDNITFSQANMHELKDSLTMELSNFPRQWSRRVAGFWLFLGCTCTAGLLNGRSHVLPKYPEEKTFAGASWCDNCMLRFGFTSQVRLAVWKSTEFLCLFNSTHHATKMELWDKWCFSDKFPFPKKHFCRWKNSVNDWGLLLLDSGKMLWNFWRKWSQMPSASRKLQRRDDGFNCSWFRPLAT